MVSLIKIDFEELKNFVTVAYNGDEDLLNKYHVGKYSLEEAVNVTMNMIEITSMDAPITYFGVVINGERIGYLCTFKNNLFSFGIDIKKRVGIILSEFWNRIKEVLGNSFISMLFPNNTRAINWLKKCQMQEVESEEDNCVTLLYHNLN